MPFYAYECECGHEFEVVLKMSESDAHQDCPKCESAETRKTVPKTLVIFKGDGWVDKNLRIKKQMAEKNRRLGAKQDARRKEAPTATLTPNVDGEKVDSWKDAKKLAKSKGKKASSYDKMIRKESSA